MWRGKGQGQNGNLTDKLDLYVSPNLDKVNDLQEEIKPFTMELHRHWAQDWRSWVHRHCPAPVRWAGTSAKMCKPAAMSGTYAILHRIGMAVVSCHPSHFTHISFLPNHYLEKQEKILGNVVPASLSLHSAVTIWSIFLLGESDNSAEIRIKEGVRHTEIWEQRVTDRAKSEGESLTWNMLRVLPEQEGHQHGCSRVRGEKDIIKEAPRTSIVWGFCSSSYSRQCT